MACAALLWACGAEDESASSPGVPGFVPPASPQADLPATGQPRSPGAPEGPAAPPPRPAAGAVGEEPAASPAPLDEQAADSSPSESPTAASTVPAPLPRRSPESQGVSSAGVASLVAALDEQIDEIHSVMLVRHGNVVAEGWWAPYTPESIHVLYSVSKSFNATAVGLAAQEGLLALQDPVATYFPDLLPAAADPEMLQVTVEDLLMMASGHQADTMDRLRARADGQWTRAFLETDIENPPGSSFVYNSGASYMLAALVQRTTGTRVLEYLEPRLLSPLGIEGAFWGQSPEGVDLAGGGLSVKTEDLAKFGQLYLQRGNWEGQQLLREEWVDAATSAQISTGNGDGNWNHGYGYQFWRSAYGYRADGSLGQFVFVLPQSDAVLVITAATNDTDRVMNLVWENLIPALRPETLAESPADLAQLQARLSALSLAVPAGAATSSLAGQISGVRYTAQSNSQGISALSLETDGSTAVLTIEDGDGTHGVGVGIGRWQYGRTGLRKRISELYDTPEQGIAARGAWESESTFVARLTFDETPYTMQVRLRFDGDQLFADMSYNVRWGATSEPQIVATR